MLENDITYITNQIQKKDKKKGADKSLHPHPVMVIMVKKVTILNLVIMVYNVKAYSNTTHE